MTNRSPPDPAVTKLPPVPGESSRDARRLTMAQVSRLTGLPTHTIRYYEREFPRTLTVARSPGGHRWYTFAQVAELQRICRWLHCEGLSIREVRARLGECAASGPDGPPAARSPNRVRSVRDWAGRAAAGSRSKPKPRPGPGSPPDEVVAPAGEDALLEVLTELCERLRVLQPSPVAMAGTGGSGAERRSAARVPVDIGTADPVQDREICHVRLVASRSTTERMSAAQHPPPGGREDRHQGDVRSSDDAGPAENCAGAVPPPLLEQLAILRDENRAVLEWLNRHLRVDPARMRPAPAAPADPCPASLGPAWARRPRVA